MAKNSIEVVDQTTGEVTVSMPKLKLKKRVTIPLLKQRAGGDGIAVVFLSPIYQGEKIEGSKIQEPAKLARVLNVVDGQVYQIILHTVTIKELTKAYPDDAYVGKGFAIRLHSVEDKQYLIAEISEFDTSDFEAAITAADLA